MADDKVKAKEKKDHKTLITANETVEWAGLSDLKNSKKRKDPMSEHKDANDRLITTIKRVKAAKKESKEIKPISGRRRTSIEKVEYQIVSTSSTKGTSGSKNPIPRTESKVKSNDADVITSSASTSGEKKNLIKFETEIINPPPFSTAAQSVDINQSFAGGNNPPPLAFYENVTPPNTSPNLILNVQNYTTLPITNDMVVYQNDAWRQVRRILSGKLACGL